MNEHDGLVDEKMTKLFGKSWRTTLGGALSFGCGVVVVADQFVAHPVLHAAAGACMALGLASAGVVGVAAKDKRTTGAQR
ncbi:MAG: hypothetical protein ACK52I_01640 [Pseudomonadota bacterium]|jgi:hypothetical protein